MAAGVINRSSIGVENFRTEIWVNDEQFGVSQSHDIFYVRIKLPFFAGLVDTLYVIFGQIQRQFSEAALQSVLICRNAG
jgi:hypothetical protein